MVTPTQQWYYTRFDAVDILYVGPAVCRRTDHVFSLQYFNDENVLVDYSKRFEWVIKRARYINPQIKIIVSQWWGGSNVLVDLKSDFNEKVISTETASRIEKYIDWVRDFLSSWQRKTYSQNGKTVFFRMDGYDVDYEPENTVDIVSTVFEKIRRKVDKFSDDNHVPSYLLSLTPAEIDHVKDVNAVVDYINLQTYDEGRRVSAKQYVKLINPSPSTKLIWGLTAEATLKNWPKGKINFINPTVADVLSIDEQLDKITHLQLGGIFVWRLNSNNWITQFSYN